MRTSGGRKDLDVQVTMTSDNAELVVKNVSEKMDKKVHDGLFTRPSGE